MCFLSSSAFVSVTLGVLHPLGVWKGLLQCIYFVAVPSTSVFALALFYQVACTPTGHHGLNVLSTVEMAIARE